MRSDRHYHYALSAKNVLPLVGFEVLTPVIMKSLVFWVITPLYADESKPSFRRNLPPSYSGYASELPAAYSILVSCLP